ncbi:UDP-Glycosyltransferase/glycogen phosphorylase [Marasmius fiardii PR-910]|nr:UDP-Glycosyltransferase/glycogen phosphorylase [Marasmius fiardii PR-910]
MTKHILFYTIPAWGHIKSLISLMTLIAELRQDVTLTFITNVMYSKIVAEFSRLPKERYEKIQERIQVIDIPNPIKDLTPSADPGFTDAFGRLYRSESLTCATSGKTIGPGLPKPCLAIIDPFAVYAIDTIRTMASPQDLPIFCWMSAPAGPLIRFFGPKSLGGMGDIAQEIDSVVSKTGRDRAEVEFEIFGQTTGEVVTIPGYPPLFDYEWFQQDVDIAQVVQVVLAAKASVHKSEGTLFVTASVIEREAIEAMREYLGSFGKRLTCVGLVSSIMPQGQEASTRDDEGVIEFLDRTYEEHGANSLIYIAFGSVWWPKDSSKIFAVIDELIHRRVPFLFAHGSPMATVSEEIKAKIAASGVGKEIKWAPQEVVLKHRATGWFITHGGWNSVQEGIQYGVPLIFWPMGADQPMNASLMTRRHRAGFQLISVRTGKHAKKPYQCEQQPLFDVEAVREELGQLLDKMKGEEGRTVRRNLERLREGVLEGFAEGGEARVEIEGILKEDVL